MADESELDRIDPQPTEVKLASGFPVEVVRLRTRQLFRLMRILTKGAGPALGQLNFGGDTSQFGQQLLGVIVMAIPDAEQETIGFLQSMCRPAGLIEKGAAQLTKQDAKHNEELFGRFQEELFNPELEDTIAILEEIVNNEAGELQSLGKKLQHLWTVARKAIARPEEQATEDPLLSADTPGSSTSSAGSTDGATRTSSTSRSAASGRRPKQLSSASS